MQTLTLRNLVETIFKLILNKPIEAVDCANRFKSIGGSMSKLFYSATLFSLSAFANTLFAGSTCSVTIKCPNGTGSCQGTAVIESSSKHHEATCGVSPDKPMRWCGSADKNVQYNASYICCTAAGDVFATWSKESAEANCRSSGTLL